MNAREQITLIDEAINEVLAQIRNGNDITEWEMDGIKIKRKSSFELLEELGKIKQSLVAKTKPKSVQFVFGG
ncbi:hypothetical protein LS71_002670 [Helicobacter jaachi]|uniref:Uncharacterized protein n=1 Tax=Helicobacter jaachi TaxID=1677920 RepID=A0A4V6I2V8_9HELI|nr:hypothetical protein [Helicobacter jaachi]TLD97662.1 hypothetical protein LS71_002670 [Helicobacter jaachi]